MTNKTNGVICIIGMHRSGTSMVAHLLRSAGLELGPSENIYLDSVEDNPEGHFEHKAFHKINETLLAHFGGSWDNPPQLKPDWEYDPTLSEISRNAKKLLQEFNEYPHWGWKDPRTTILLPFWTSLIANLHFVICVRNPLEVAQSLARRDRIPIQTGGYLWQQYMQAALRDTAGFPRIITFYEDFFKDPAKEAKRLIKFCGLPMPSDLSTISQVVSPGLKHHTAQLNTLLNESKLLNEHKLFYMGLRTLVSGDSHNPTITEGLSKYLELFEQTPDHQTDLINSLQIQLQKHHHQARAWSDQTTRLGSLDQKIALLQKTVTEKDAELQRYQRASIVEEERASQLITEQEIMRQEIALLQGTLHERDSDTQQYQQAAQEAEGRVGQLITEQEMMRQEIVLLQGTLYEKDSDIQQYQQAAQEAEGRVDQLITEREMLRQEVSFVRGTVYKKDSELQRLQQVVQEVEEQTSQQITIQKTMRDKMANLQRMIAQKNSEAQRLQQVAQEADRRESELITKRDEMRQEIKELQHQQATLYQREGELRAVEVEHTDLQRQINAIVTSRGYKPLAAYWHLADRLVPVGSRRRKMAEFIMRAPGLLTWHNIRSVMRQVRLYGVATTYQGASAKVKDEVNGQVNIIQTQPRLGLGNGYSSSAKATVSVVIPVKNAGSDLRHSLTRLTNQQGIADMEIIIVDSGSTDQSLAIAEEFGTTIVRMPPHEFSHAEARNIGAEQATGDYILFTVQDALPPSDSWLVNLLKTLQQENVAAISCMETPRDDADLFYKANAWQYSRFMAVDNHDRIMRQPDEQNYLTLRKNSALSNIACLISRDTFLQYKFRGEYAEDLDLGLRLIRDGHQLALLGSTRIIHSHNRPPYAHLKRGYIDELTLAEIFPDRPVLESDPQRLFSDLVFVYNVLCSITDEGLKSLKSPCRPKDLSTAVMKRFRTAAKQHYPSQISLNGNPYLSTPFKTFLQTVTEHYQDNSFINTKYAGTLLERFKAYVMLIIDYLNNHYELVDQTSLEDFKYSLYKAYAFLSGTHLASCSRNSNDQANEMLAAFNYWLADDSDQIMAPSISRSSASSNGSHRNGQVAQLPIAVADPPLTNQKADQKRARLIALYLPQFHPIPENNEWWGEGFTEWTNVTKTKPLFDGHYQPHLPADLGFYDLRLSEARLAQANLARQYGIEGFCYYHYWFNGRRLLEQPFNEVLASGEPNFPFCLAWANETWSRRWLGEEKAILIKQEYSAADDLKHARWLVNAFADPRNIRVQGRPLYLVYRPKHMPDAQRSMDILRETCLKHGLPNPFLLGINAHAPDVDFRTLGFDGTMNFEPWLGALPDVMDDSLNEAKLARNLKLGIASKKLKIYDYVDARQKMLSYKKKHPVYPSIFVGWDNAPRRGENGIVMVNSTPENFKAGLADMVASVQKKPFDDRLVFVNAWNEWAEGNHLEPDQKHGLAYLEAVRRVNAINSE